jgi:hypothetical protein
MQLSMKKSFCEPLSIQTIPKDVNPLLAPQMMEILEFKKCTLLLITKKVLRKKRLSKVQSKLEM